MTTVQAFPGKKIGSSPQASRGSSGASRASTSRSRSMTASVERQPCSAGVRARRAGRRRPRRDPAPARRRPARRSVGNWRPARAARADPGRLPVARPARPAGHRAGRGRGQPPRRRVRLDGAPAARDRRARWRGPALLESHARRSRGAAPGAPERPRRPARHLAQPGEHLRSAREVRPRPDGRGAGRQARPGHRPRRRDPAHRSRSSRDGRRTTRC